MRWAWLIVGVLAILVGAVWTLQGLNVLKGSCDEWRHDVDDHWDYRRRRRAGARGHRCGCRSQARANRVIGCQ